jgi:hypothetical protein
MTSLAGDGFDIRLQAGAAARVMTGECEYDGDFASVRAHVISVRWMQLKVKSEK